MLYGVQLLTAAVIAAFALIDDRLEASVAAMLVSPIGGQLAQVASNIIVGNFAAVAAPLATAIGSVMVLVGVGAGARATYGGHAHTPEMKKRQEPFHVGYVLAFAVLVGVVDTLARASSPKSAYLAPTLAVGLAVTVSITVPLVNCGILLVDAMKRRVLVRSGVGVGNKDLQQAALGSKLSFAHAMVNIVGLMVGTAFATHVTSLLA